MIYEFECSVCGEKFECVQPMNALHIAFHCGIEARRVFSVPHTNHDLMYQFDSSAIVPNKTVNIYSRRQYRKLLKENGLVDATPRECLSVKPKTELSHKVRIKQQARALTKKIVEKGSMSWVLGKENFNGPDKLGRRN